jgi:hypothetical protein
MAVAEGDAGTAPVSLEMQSSMRHTAFFARITPVLSQGLEPWKEKIMSTLVLSEAIRARRLKQHSEKDYLY